MGRKPGHPYGSNDSMTPVRKGKVRRRASSPSEVAKVDYDCFRGPDPRWLPDPIKEELEWLRRQVVLETTAGRHQSPGGAERLYRRHFNNEHHPLEEVHAKHSMSAVVELAILCRQIAGKGIKRSEMFGFNSRYNLLRQIERARDEGLEQTKRARRRRSNALAKVIAPIVKENPNITPTQLRDALHKERGAGVIILVSPTKIEWHSTDGQNNTTSVKNLKNYLQTARKKYLPNQVKKPIS